MSTPIDPPDVPDLPDSAPAEGAEATREFADLVDETRGGSDGLEGASDAAVPDAALGALQRDLVEGRASADQAVDRLIEHAMASARGLPDAQRAALEAQLREALDADPTLVDLKKDLQRASKA